MAYLALEVRRSRLSTESSAVDAVREGLTLININVMNNPELVEIWVKGFADPDSLDEIQSTRFWFLIQAYLNRFTAIKKYYDTAALPEEEWQILSRSFAHLFNAPGGRSAFERAAVSSEITNDFGDYLKYKDYEIDGYVGIRSYEKPEL